MKKEELKEEKELMVKILKKITPDTSWHGETWADDRSIENTEVLGEMAYFIMSELFKDCVVPEGNKGNGSFEAIARKKQEIIKEIACTYFNLDLDPDYFD